jgi:hypothetical protein
MVEIIAQHRDSIIVRDLAGFALEAQEINNKFFSYRLQKKIRVYLAESESDYQKFSHQAIPEWSSGVAFTRQHIIVLKPGNYYDPKMYRQTLIHEVSHIYLSEIHGYTYLPVWLNEGTVMYLSGKSLSWEESIRIGNALSAGKLLNLGEIDSILSFVSAKANLAYLESFLAVQFLIERHGEAKLVEIISALARNNSVDQVFLNTLGFDFFDFEIMWYENLKKQFRWIAFLQFDNLFFMLLVIFILIAILSRYYRNKKIIKRWEEEESDLFG